MLDQAISDRECFVEILSFCVLSAVSAPLRAILTGSIARRGAETAEVFERADRAWTPESKVGWLECISSQVLLEWMHRQEAIQVIVERYGLRLIVVKLESEEIARWIS